NLNDGSVEGLGHRTLPAFSVQYHPEGCPGPQDNQHLYDRFVDMVRSRAPVARAVAGMAEPARPRKVLILGSGPIVIGQAAETDLANAGVLDRHGVRVLGATIDTIRKAEDRQAFKEMLEAMGEPVPVSRVCESIEEVRDFAALNGLPLVIRPAYTLGGTGGGF